MPRIGRPPVPDEFPGTLRVNQALPHVVEAFYVPSPERIERAGLTSNGGAAHSVRLLSADSRSGSLTIFPTKTTGNQDGFLRPKYSQVERIVLVDGDYLEFGGDLPSSQEDFMLLLESLPSCFVKDYDYGLGLTQKYRAIITAIESNSECNEIHVTADDGLPVGADGRTLRISTSDFTRMRKASR